MPSDDAFDLLESVADFLCSYDRDGTAVLIRAVAKEYERKAAEIERLQSIVDKLPQTADGVPVVPNMRIWLPCETAGYHGQPPGKAVEAVVIWVSTEANPMAIQFHSGENWNILGCRVFSSREAVEAAKEVSDAE